jgi:GNAT superfamily N-acetyltransferase
MRQADVPVAMRLKELAGWNQTAADWRRFLDGSPSGCFVAELDETVRGTVTTIPFEHRVAWIGMVLVDPDYRGQGLGTTLLRRAIDHLDALRIPVLKLDATPQGRPLYEKLGFRAEYEIGRWTRRRASSPTAKPPEGDVRASISSELLESICKADREIFGADRGALLRSLHADAPEFTRASTDAGRVTGYAFGRRGSFADHLGPWIARDADTAGHLLDAFLASSSREMQIADCLSGHGDARDLLQSHAFSYTRPLTRMFRGSNASPGRPELVCAILGPEFG